MIGVCDYSLAFSRPNNQSIKTFSIYVSLYLALFQPYFNYIFFISSFCVFLTNDLPLKDSKVQRYREVEINRKTSDPPFLLVPFLLIYCHTFPCSLLPCPHSYFIGSLPNLLSIFTSPLPVFILLRKTMTNSVRKQKMFHD